MQENNIISIFKNAMLKNAIDAIFYVDAPEAWNEVWLQLQYQAVSAHRTSLLFSQTYLVDSGHKVYDLSLILCSDGRPVGLLPLSLEQIGQRWKFGSMGGAVTAPMFVPLLSPRTIKKLCVRILNVLQQLVSDLSLDQLCTEQPNSHLIDAAGSCSQWHQLLMSVGATLQTRHDLLVDLSLDLTSIRSMYRKSYRPLINLALKTWQVSVMDAKSANAQVWAEFKQLHKQVAGRSTRSDNTWELLWRALCFGEAFLVNLRNPVDNRLVGAGFFRFTRDEGVYAVGAYDRSLFDKPLGHAVQQRAIEMFKSLGVRWYLIGERFYSQSQYAPSAKEVAISEFKQGFSSHLFCRHQFTLPVISHQ
jgi:FemAB family protein